jgi:hypothetical protein
VSAARRQELDSEIRAQWAKFDAAVAAGMTGAPLAQIDKKLARLERERETLEIVACKPDCILPPGHDGDCTDDPPLSDPRPDPRTHPEFWRE